MVWLSNSWKCIIDQKKYLNVFLQISFNKYDNFGYWYHMVFQVLVIIGSGNGTVPNGHQAIT